MDPSKIDLDAFYADFQGLLLTLEHMHSLDPNPPRRLSLPVHPTDHELARYIVDRYEKEGPKGYEIIIFVDDERPRGAWQLLPIDDDCEEFI